MLYHISPLKNRESILAHGILNRVPERNFRCDNVVYLTTSTEHAHRWAAEVARETGETDFALFEISDLGVSYDINPNTEIDTPQVVLEASIPADKIVLIDTLLNVFPLPNMERLIVRVGGGYAFCSECERNIKDDPDIVDEHLWNFHEEVIESLANG